MITTLPATVGLAAGRPPDLEGLPPRRSRSAGNPRVRRPGPCLCPQQYGVPRVGVLANRLARAAALARRLPGLRRGLTPRAADA